MENYSHSIPNFGNVLGKYLMLFSILGLIIITILFSSLGMVWENISCYSHFWEWNGKISHIILNLENDMGNYSQLWKYAREISHVIFNLGNDMGNCFYFILSLRNDMGSYSHFILNSGNGMEKCSILF